MVMKRSGRRPASFSPSAERCEGRLLLSAARVHTKVESGLLVIPGGEHHPVRPNTPVLPYGSPANVATFIDPSAKIQSGRTITLGGADYVAPYARLDGTGGAIRIGSGSAVLDNALIAPNNAGQGGTPFVSIGERVVVSYGAQITGNTSIGGFGTAAAPTSVGSNAVVDSSTIAPGAIVGAGAVVRGVTVPAGFAVLPHAVVTTEAEASNPALGKVARVTTAQTTAITTELSSTAALANGYTNLYQGQAATGAAGSLAAATSVAGLNNGNLTTVEGSSLEPGTTVVSFEPSRRGPRFPAGPVRTYQGTFYNFPARVVGGVVFRQKAHQVASHLGKHVSIRGDEGQPITIGSIAGLGNNVTIHAVRNGNLTVGTAFRAGSGSVIIGGTGSTIGNGVTLGQGVVVENSKIGSGVMIGDGAYVSGSTVPDGTVIAPGEVLINGVRS